MGRGERRDKEMEVGILNVPLKASDEACENSAEQDIMQVQCVMDILTFRIHKYNIIDGRVRMKSSLFRLKKGTNLNDF